MLIAILMAFASAAFTVYLPIVIKNISAVIEKGLTGVMDTDAILRYTILAGVLIVAGLVFNYVQTRLMVSVTVKLSKVLRAELADKVDRIPISYYDNTLYGDTLSRLTNDVETLTGALSNNMITVFTAAVQVAGCLIFMIAGNWILALCVIVSSLLAIYITRILSKMSKPSFKAQQKNLGELNGLIEESISGQLVIKAFNCESDVEEAFSGKNEQLYATAWRSQFLAALMSPVMQLSGNISYVLVCVVGAYLAFKNIAGATIPVIISFILYARNFSTKLTQISHGYSMIMPSFAAADRIFEFMDIPEMEDSGTEHLDGRARGDVSFSHVKFGYLPDQTIIHDFSAEVKAGQKVAIVGPTGAGKSTMVNLLMRFYELEGGSISIDGIPINRLSRDELHHQISMVLQDTWIFEGSIRENIVYNTPDISDERLLQAISCLLYTSPSPRLPEGVDTVIGERSAVSAGQKQLMTIARAMIEDAPVLVLDEATSSIDTRLEVMIQAAIDKLTKGRTSFVIAHRLSTIRNADVIFVMKDGDVVEVGDHDTLLKKGGLYADLYNSQFDAA